MNNKKQAVFQVTFCILQPSPRLYATLYKLRTKKKLTDTGAIFAPLRVKLTLIHNHEHETSQYSVANWK